MLQQMADNIWKAIKFWFWIVFGVVFVAMVVATYAAYEWGIWHECLRDHSWFYCHRIL